MACSGCRGRVIGLQEIAGQSRRRPRAARSAAAWPACGDGLDPRARARAARRLEIVGRDEAVAGAAHEQRRRRSTRCRRCLQLGIVHVRLPDEQRQRLAVARDDVQLLVGQRREIERELRRDRGNMSFGSFSRRHREDVGNVELVGRAGLHADRADEHQPLDALGHLGRHLRGDPAADRAADEIDRVETQPVHQFEIDVRDVVDAVEPVRQRRVAEARMRGRDHAPAFARASR